MWYNTQRLSERICSFMFITTTGTPLVIWVPGNILFRVVGYTRVVTLGLYRSTYRLPHTYMYNASLFFGLFRIRVQRLLRKGIGLYGCNLGSTVPRVYTEVHT